MSDAKRVSKKFSNRAISVLPSDLFRFAVAGLKNKPSFMNSAKDGIPIAEFSVGIHLTTSIGSHEHISKDEWSIVAARDVPAVAQPRA